MTLAAIEPRISGGESATLELKESTGQLNRAGETLCAFLNGDGGTMIVGVTPEGRIVGQELTDKTRCEIAAMLDRFEPPPLVEVVLPRSSAGRGRSQGH
jgi:ATP-dependent DNA helicase RecG